METKKAVWLKRIPFTKSLNKMETCEITISVQSWSFSHFTRNPEAMASRTVCTICSMAEYMLKVVALHKYTFCANCSRTPCTPLVTNTSLKSTAQRRYICRRMLCGRDLKKQCNVCLTLSTSNSIFRKFVSVTRVWILDSSETIRDVLLMLNDELLLIEFDW